MFNVSAITALSAFILILHIHEVMTAEPPAAEDHSFLGYDFSEGYTSLERSVEGGLESEDDADRADRDEAVRTGILERWKSRREEERQRKESEQQEVENQQLDEILAKLHEQGRDALSPANFDSLTKSASV